jgi:antitoxin PrlF
MATTGKAARRRPLAQSRITSKGQATIPAVVRRKLSLRPGDRVIFEESERGEIVVHKAEPLDIEFLRALEGTLSEWNSQADDLAYDDL